MDTLTTNIILVVWLHFIGDFIFQTRNMARNKSKSLKWLTLHVLTYMIPLFIIGPVFAILNGIMHWAVDWETSWWTSKYHREQNEKMFFMVIGLDQAIHLTILIIILINVGG